MKTFFSTLYAVAILLLVAGCSATPETHELSSGAWRGEFAVNNDTRIPFTFVVRDSAGHANVFLTNGAEKAPLDSVYYKGDSVVIAINLFDAVLTGKITGDSLHGYFRKNQAARQGLAFHAVRAKQPRFAVNDSTNAKAVRGRWSVTLTSERDGKSTSRYTVGLLEQRGHKVTGTILSTTGDYRYLEGVIDGNQLKLSAFSGSSPALLQAELTDSITLRGEYITPGGKTIVQAIKSDTAALPDAYSLTHLKAGSEKLSFTFPDLDGKPVSLADSKYKDKVVIVTILGSWCPNCIDEAAFLAPWFKENKNRGVEIVGLAFERKDDPAFAKARLGNLIKRFDIQYDILFAGVSDKKVVAEKLPELASFISFPTTFFIDKAGKVRKVHTGYNGPATGEYYDAFIREFNGEVDALINEASPGVTAAL